MDPIARMVAAGAAGASGSSATYVDDVFSTFLFEGNNSTQTINNGIDLSGEGGLVWIKNRTTSGYNHTLYDTTRSGTLFSDAGNGDSDYSSEISSFNNDGFSLVNGSTSTYNNKSGQNYASWTFRKAPGFFDIVTFTGSGSVQNISHSLGSVPGMIVVKKTSGSGSWNTYHRSLGANGVIYLNGNHGNSVDNGVWNNTAPTSSVFTVGADAGVNENGATYIAYVFAHDDQSFGTDQDEAIIKCGSYTGNYSTNGPEIDLGFELQFLLLKRADNSDDWFMVDNMRGLPKMQAVYPNKNNAEQDWGNTYIRFTSTGFKLTTQNSMFNQTEEYIYMAIRRPNKPPTAGTDVFAIDTKTAASGNTPQYTSNFPVDFAIRRNNINSQDSPEFVTRMTNALQYTNSTNAESDGGPTFLEYFAHNNGWANATNADSNDYLWMFRRAPGFMDVVAYNGSGTARLIPHNLEAVPQMIIVKRRNGIPHWQHWYYSLGAGGLIQSADGDPGAAATTRPHWNNTLPTATHFSVGTDGDVNNSSGTYIAYLFGSLNGISKVGEYTGTGSNVNVDCGFSAGARFVMIKRRDGSGDFYIWDSLRGIVSGNDPYFLFNSNAAQVTNTDYIDPLSSGFTVTSNAPAALNASGGTYLFLAIA